MLMSSFYRTHLKRVQRNKEPLDSIESRGSVFKCRHGPTFPLKQYHRPHRLNGRVRNGNGCGPVGMGTDKSSARTIHPGGGVLLFDIKSEVFAVRCPLSVVRCICIYN